MVTCEQQQERARGHYVQVAGDVAIRSMAFIMTVSSFVVVVSRASRRCGGLNVFGLVDAQIALVELELLAGSTVVS